MNNNKLSKLIKIGNVEKIAQDGGIILYFDNRNAENEKYELHIDITNLNPKMKGTLKQCITYLLDNYNYSVFMGIVKQIEKWMNTK